MSLKLARRRSRTCAAAAILAASLALTACTSGQPAGPGDGSASPAIKKGGTLRISLGSDPGNLDPTVSNMQSSSELYPAMCDGLYLDLVDGDVPVIATGDPVYNADRTAVDIKIRPDAVFADGTKVDAEAVKITLDRNINFPTSQRGAELAFVKSVEAVDATTVRIHLKAPVALGVITDSLANRAGKILSPTALKTLGDDGFNAAPVCSGPFKFASRVAQTSVTLEKDPNYFDADKVNLDSVVYMVAPQAAVRNNNLLSGDLDVVTHVNPTDAKTLLADERLTSTNLPGNGFIDLIPNIANHGSGKSTALRDTPLAKSADLRRAFSLAIDRDKINQAVYSGEYGIACTFVSPQSTLATEHNTACEKYDPEEAKKLVAASGYKTPIKVDLLLNQMTDFSQIAQLVQQMVKEVGFELTLDVQESTTAAQRTQTGEFDLYLNMWTGKIDPHTNVSHFYYSKDPANMAKFPDPELDGLIDKASQAGDTAERSALYDQIVDRLNAASAGIYLLRPSQIVVYDKAVTGLRFRGTGSVSPAYAGFVE